jgi:WD40 repeat protein
MPPRFWVETTTSAHILVQDIRVPHSDGEVSMAAVNACPPVDVLEQLMLGNVSAARLAELSSHLESCSRCQERALSISAHDPLLETARERVQATQEIIGKVPAELWTRLQELPQSPPTALTQDITLSQSSAPDQATQSTEHTPDDRALLAPPQQPDEIGRLGPYRVLGVLGRGGMGVVYLADDPRLQRRVALKAMLPRAAAKPAAEQRFLREARAAAALSSEHIAHIYDVGAERGVLYLAMEHLQGCPLDRHLADGTPRPVAEILRIGRDVATGLAIAHEKGLIHRDIKPGNIWLEQGSGRCKLLDFGLARANNDAQITQSGAIIGTPAYMAPEQARGESVDARADLFSLGCVLYRLCTGSVPFRGRDAISVLMALAVDNPASPHSVNAAIPRSLSDLVMRLLAKEAASRPASAREVIRELDQIETAQAHAANPVAAVSPAPPVPAPARPPAGTGKWVAVACALTAAVAVVAVAGIVLYWPTSQGVVRIEIDDPDVKVAIDGSDFKIQGADKHELILAPGEHGLRIKRGDFEFATDRFILSKGGKVTLRVEMLKGKIQVVHDGQVIGARDLPVAKAPAPKDTPQPKVVSEVPPPPSLVTVDKLTLDPRTPILKGHTYQVRGLAFLPDSQRAVSIGWDGKALLWDLTTGKEPRNLLPADFYDKNLNTVAIAPNGKLAAVGGSAGYLWLCDLEKPTPHRALRLAGTKNYSTNALMFTHEGRRVVTGVGSQLFVFDVASGEKLEGPTSLPGSLMNKVVLPGTNQVLCQGKGELVIWDLDKGAEAGRAKAPKKRIMSLAILPDGRRLVAGCEDHALALLDLDGKEPRFFEAGHSHFIRSVAALNQGRWVLSASEDKTVRLWDVATGKQIDKVTAPNYVVAIAAVNSDGKRLLTGSGWRLVDKTYVYDDYDLRLWQLPTPPAKAANKP